MNRMYILMSTILMAFFAIETKAQPDSWVSGTRAGHDYANLGLPSGTLWATCNIGANAPEEYGDFFAWGEVEPKDWFIPENYLYHTGEIIQDPRYGEFYECIDIGWNISGTEYDAATQLWGNGWRMPTQEEQYELTMMCWSNGIVEENGVKGQRFCGPNTNSIFIPAAGAGAGPGAQYELPEGKSAVLWMGEAKCDIYNNGVPDSTIYVPERAYCIYYDDGAGAKKMIGLRYTGKNIRPVYNPKENTGVKTLSQGKNISISYSNGNLFVGGLSGRATVKISDMSGRTFQHFELDQNVSTNVSLPCGIYIVNVVNDNGLIATKKIISF